MPQDGNPNEQHDFGIEVTDGSFSFRSVNDQLKQCVKIKEPGVSKFKEGDIIGKEAFEEERTRLEAEDKALATRRTVAGRRFARARPRPTNG